MRRVGIVGYRGYSGAELVHLLDHHAHVEPVLMDHREDPGGTAAIRRAQPPPRIACTGDAVRQEGLAVAFLATPPEVSMDLAPAWWISAAPSAWARRRTTRPGIRKPTPSRNCWPRRSTGYPSFAANSSL